MPDFPSPTDSRQANSDALVAGADHLLHRIGFFKRFPEQFRATACIESMTPLHIGSGLESGDSDAGVVLDANGLATIPGSSLRGILRAAFAGIKKTGTQSSPVNRIFGGSDDDSTGSRLRLTWGSVHSSLDSPVSGLLDPDQIESDPVLSAARMTEVRDHASLDCKSMSKNKFDDLSVIAGHRFTFSLSLVTDGSAEDAADWNLILGLLTPGGTLRIGGKTRRGFGAFLVRGLSAEPSVNLQPALCETSLCDTTLVPEGGCFWMFGGGADDETGADSAPVLANRILWNKSDRGSLTPEPVPVIPGSSLKGALRHRTFYHLCRRYSVWADKLESRNETSPELGQVKRAIKLLFGDVETVAPADSSRHTPPREVASRGNVFIDDLFPDPNSIPLAAMQNHVAIDRALGGAHDHALYSDRPHASGGFRLRISLDAAPDGLDAGDKSLMDDAITALKNALADLENGRLALGAHVNRGYGRFSVAK